MMKTSRIQPLVFLQKSRLLFLFVSTVLLFASCRQKEAYDYYQQGYDHALKSEHEQAIKYYKKAIKKDKNFPKAYLGLGNSYYNLKDRESALHYYNLAIEIDSTFADAYYNRGQLKFYAGDEYGACQDYAEAYYFGRPNMDDILKRCFNLYLVRPRIPKEPWEE